jgi:hypothetical protein
VAPQSVARGPAKRGSGSGGDARPRQGAVGVPPARYGIASSRGRHCSSPPRSRSILPRPIGPGFADGLPCQTPSKGTPQSVARGTLRSGIGQRRGCQDRARNLLGRLHPAAGSHLPLEDTAPPFAVVPFASSSFAHHISQSCRRADRDLFRGSLD